MTSKSSWFGGLSSSKGSWTGSSVSNSTLSSLDGSLKMSSHASYQVGRGAAKLGVDIMTLSEGGKVQTVTGKKYMSLMSDLDYATYNLLVAADKLELVTINYCQRGLEQLRDVNWKSLGNLRKGSTSDTPSNGIESIKALKGIINHDYLVLEMQSGDPAVPIFYIVAQKLSGEQPGIHISAVLPEKKEEVLHEGVLHYSIDCKHKKIRLNPLIEILMQGDPHYNLRNANCWDYATAAAKRLVHECAMMDGTTTEEQDRLEQEQADLEANLSRRSIRSTAKMLLESVPQIFHS